MEIFHMATKRRHWCSFSVLSAVVIRRMGHLTGSSAAETAASRYTAKLLLPVILQSPVSTSRVCLPRAGRIPLHQLKISKILRWAAYSGRSRGKPEVKTREGGGWVARPVSPYLRSARQPAECSTVWLLRWVVYPSAQRKTRRERAFPTTCPFPLTLPSLYSLPTPVAHPIFEIQR